MAVIDIVSTPAFNGVTKQSASAEKASDKGQTIRAGKQSVSQSQSASAEKASDKGQTIRGGKQSVSCSLGVYSYHRCALKTIVYIPRSYLPGHISS